VPTGHRRCRTRRLLTQPLDAQADAFYRRFGFEPLPMGERHLILLLKDARRVAMSAANTQ